MNNEKVKVGNDQEMAQSERNSHSKNQGVKKTKLKSGTYTKKIYFKPNGQNILKVLPAQKFNIKT